MKRKIGIDIDDVLADFLPTFIGWHNKVHDTSVNYENFWTYQFEGVFGLPAKTMGERVKTFLASREFKEMKPVFGAQEAIKALSQKYFLSVITSRPEMLEQATFSWIYSHFGSVFERLHFAKNSYVSWSNHLKTKREICLEEGIALMLEDSPDYAISLADTNIPVVLRDTPWNRKINHPRIHRARDMIHAAEIIPRVMDNH